MYRTDESFRTLFLNSGLLTYGWINLHVQVKLLHPGLQFLCLLGASQVLSHNYNNHSCLWISLNVS